MKSLNIEQCVFCGYKDVPDRILEIPIGILGIVSVKVNGAQCNNCGEKYFDSDDMQAIREFKKAHNEHAVGA